MTVIHDVRGNGRVAHLEKSDLVSDSVFINGNNVHIHRDDFKTAVNELGFVAFDKSDLPGVHEARGIDVYTEYANTRPIDYTAIEYNRRLALHHLAMYQWCLDNPPVVVSDEDVTAAIGVILPVLSNHGWVGDGADEDDPEVRAVVRDLLATGKVEIKP